MANVITTTINFVTDRAQSAVKGFRSSVAEADGAMGKFRAGASSALTTVQANAGSLALAGGAALVTFGTKAVTAFQDTAIAAGKFSDATGLAVEDASRLAEVAGDVGVEASAIEGAIVRMNAAAAKGDLADLGVEIQRTADGATDVNATFLETIRVLNGIKDPTERALAAQKIFGRGYKEVAEIIFDSADNVATKLGEVSEAKVIDPEELAKAREFRRQMDDLNDALQDIQLAAGEALVPMLGDLADIVVLARDAEQALEDMIPGDDPGFLSRGAIPLFVASVKDLKDAFDGGSESGNLFKATIESMLPEINEAGNVVRDLGDEVDAAAAPTSSLVDQLRDFGNEAGDAGRAADDFGDALQDALAQEAEEAAGRFEAAMDRVIGKLDEAFDRFDNALSVQDTLANIADGWDEIAEAEQAMLEGGEQERRDYERQVRDQRREVRNLVDELDNLPISKKISLLAEIDDASLGELQTIVSNLSAGINVPVTFIPRSATELTSAQLSTGGIVNPTFAAPQQSAIPGGTFNVTNIYPVGSTPTTQYQDQQTDIRRNGIRLS